MIFSFPLIKIFVERMNFKQNSDQYPINFLHIKQFFVAIIGGRNIIEIIIIPVKKNSEKTKLLSILKIILSLLNFVFF